MREGDSGLRSGRRSLDVALGLRSHTYPVGGESVNQEEKVGKLSSTLHSLTGSGTQGIPKVKAW